MTSEFLVSVTSRFERELKKLAGQHPGLVESYARVVDILKTDPYNHNRRHPIKKLTSIVPGQGQYRIRAGRFRFRYDIDRQNVYSKACSLRRDDTY